MVPTSGVVQNISTEIKQYIPQIRPHIRRQGETLFFMISTRPILTLSPTEVFLYEKIDGRTTVAELECAHPGASEHLLQWHKAEILELFPPISPPAQPHLIVIEPHPDDAALSVGGRLFNRRGQCRITILSVVKRSNFTSYLIAQGQVLGVDEVTELRKQESDFAARLFGAEYRSLDWADAPLRLVPPERWSPAITEAFRANPLGFVNQLPSRTDISGLAEELWNSVRALSPNELWIPMGLGEHVDHCMTRSACLLMLARHRSEFTNVAVSMYEEIPYRTGRHAEAIQSALSSSGGRLARGAEDITDVFEDKLRAVSIYASQFKLSYIKGKLCRAAREAAGIPNRFAEGYYRLEEPIQLPQESRLSRNHNSLSALKKKLHRLWQHRTERRRLTLIALPTGHLGQWDINYQTLADAFSGADFRIYFAEEMAWEAKLSGKDHGTPKIVRRTWREWAAAVVREFFCFGTPTIVVWSDAYRTGLKKQLIRSVLPFRSILFCKNVSDLCGVLQEQL